jgi:hypothetical protein
MRDDACGGVENTTWDIAYPKPTLRARARPTTSHSRAIHDSSTSAER